MQPQHQKRPLRKKIRRALLATAFVASSPLLYGLPVMAAPAPAGLVIQNKATGSFIDTDNIEKTLESNVVQVTVAEVAGINVVASGSSGTVSAGNTAYFSYTVTNVGNDATQFFIPGNATVTGNGTQNGNIQITGYNLNGTTPITLAPASYVNVAAAGIATGNASALDANGVIQPGGSVTIRVPVQINTSAAANDVITVLFGDTPVDATSGATPQGRLQNQAYIDENTDSKYDTYTVDNANGTIGENNGPPINGDTTNHRQEASAAQNATVLGVDYGDAPDTGSGTGTSNYQTTLSDGGPSHFIVSGLRLGTNIDSDSSLLQNAAANADDTTGTPADEDGIASFPTLNTSSGKTYTVPVTVTNTTGQAAYLVGYADFNKDGDFADAGEQSATVTVSASGSQNIVFTTPTGMTLGNTYARFRLSSTKTEVESSIGASASGEVEDYLLAITPIADIITSKIGATTAVAGSTVTYTITAVNNGPDDAANVIITDNIGTGLTNVVPSNGGSYNATSGIVTFPTIASLANGATQTYTISVTAPASGSITDIVSSTSATADPTPGNNDGTAANETVTTTITPSADLVTTKTGPATALAGTTVTYTLSTVNNGPSPAANVVVTDNIGTGLTNVVPSNGGSYSSTTGIVTFPAIASLANGATQTYTISVTAPFSGTITDVVASNSITSDPDPSNNNGSAPTAQVVTTITPFSNIILVKRITAITGSSAIQGGENVALYKDDNSNPYDDNNITIATPNPPTSPADTDRWPNPASFLIGAVNGGNVGPKDEVEYTIYFLSAGSAPANTVTFCDRIPAHQTFIPDAYNALTQSSGGNLTDRGIAVSNAGIYQGYTNLTDGDTAQYFAPGSVLPGACGAAANKTGAVVVNLGTGATNTLGGTVDNATGIGSPPSSYGFVRFKAKVN
jgi:uncharacterized repeat protein (TIGR01451 family)